MIGGIYHVGVEGGNGGGSVMLYPASNEMPSEWCAFETKFLHSSQCFRKVPDDVLS